MELFKATVVPNKKLFRKAADAFAHKTKSMNALLIVGLIICLSEFLISVWVRLYWLLLN